MRNTFSFGFYCRQSKANKENLAPVELSIIVNGSRHFFTLPVRCTPKSFNGKRKPKEVQDYIDAMRTNLNGYLADMASEGIPLTADTLQSIIRNGGIPSYTIADLFKDYEKVLEKRIDVDMDFNHFRKYTLVRDMFFEVVDKNKEAKLLSNDDILTFKTLCAKRLSESTMAGYMSRLKAYITYGLNNAKLTINPFQGVKIKRVEKPVETITEEELNRIYKKDLHNDRLNKVRDLFCIASGTGLAFADVMELQPEDFRFEEDGKVMIIKERQKTGVTFYSVLLPIAKEIVERYNYDLSSLKISNQKTNSYLKEIQDLCNITSVESLHFHLARHFYSTYAINSGVPLEVVQKLVGHKRIQQTLHYAHLMKSTILTQVKKVDF